MKKWMTIIICAVLFMGCGPEEDQAGENVGLEIKTEVYEQEDIVIQYPQIYGMGDEDREKKINELIQDHVSEMGYFEPEVSITEDGTRWEWHLEKQMEYEVTFLDEHMISILYQGESKLYSVRDEYRFNYCVDAYTIDLNEMEELSDFVEIEENLVKKIEESTDIRPAGGKADFSQDLKKSLVEDITVEDLIRGFTEKWDCYEFCVAHNALIISIGTATVAGDYVLVEIPN